MSLVSILIPTYNRAALLKEAIESARAQTHLDIEIIVLDDASPDDTAVVVAEFEFDERVRYVRHARNLGIVGNWRAGLQLARGEFFCFLHDDDTFEPQFVAALLEPMQREPELIAAFCDHWVMDASGERSQAATEQASSHFRRDVLEPGLVKDFARAALIDSSLPVGATLFRRALIAPSFLDERARGSIDIFLFLGCVLSGHPAFYLPQRLMNYRAHDEGMSRSRPVHMAEGHIFRYRSILALPQLESLHADTKDKLRSTLAQTALTLARKGRMAPARRWARASWRVGPSQEALFVLALSCSGPLASYLISTLQTVRHRGAKTLSPK